MTGSRHRLRPLCDNVVSQSQLVCFMLPSSSIFMPTHTFTYTQPLTCLITHTHTHTQRQTFSNRSARNPEHHRQSESRKCLEAVKLGKDGDKERDGERHEDQESSQSDVEVRRVSLLRNNASHVRTIGFLQPQRESTGLGVNQWHMCDRMVRYGAN